MTQVGIPSIFMDGGDTYIGTYVSIDKQNEINSEKIPIYIQSLQ